MYAYDVISHLYHIYSKKKNMYSISHLLNDILFNITIGIKWHTKLCPIGYPNDKPDETYLYEMCVLNIENVRNK